MKRIVALTITAFVGMFLIGACSGSSNSAVPVASTEAKVLRVSHSNATTEKDQVHTYFTQAAIKVEELSSGKLKLDIYGNGAIAQDRDAFEMISMGTLDLFLAAYANFATTIPKVQIFVLPYVFPTEEVSRKFFREPAGALDELYAEFRDKWHMTIINNNNIGTRHLLGNGEPMTNIAAMKGKKIRIADSRIHFRIFETLGAIPTNINWSEIYPAYQQRLLDAGEWPLFSAASAGFAEVTSWYVYTGFQHNLCFTAIANTTWEKLTDQEKKWLVDALAFGREESYKLMDSYGEEILAEWEKKGVKIYRDIDTKPFKEALQPLYTEFRGEIGGNFIDAVTARVKELQ
jgi:TRAP-type C4-dicarboxylate transport system substrate-binding protein